MQKPIILIGSGEMGGVFARGFLKIGYTVIPVLRDTNIEQLAKEIPEPELVLIAVGESELQAVLSTLPSVWQSKLGLLQNELLPRDWQIHTIKNPTIISVWFEKKSGQDFASEVANEVMDIQEYLTDSKFDRKQLIAAMMNAINGDLEHQCMGRSAPMRLKRAIAMAKKANLNVGVLQSLKE